MHLGILAASIVFCASADASPPGQDTNPCARMNYEHKNMIDPHPLRVSKVQGFVKDIENFSVSAGCVGVFSKDQSKLIAAVQIRSDGSFDLLGIPTGNYWLVVTVEGFCPANNQIIVAGHSLRKRTLLAIMRPTGIDACSWMQLK